MVLILEEMKFCLCNQTLMNCQLSLLTRSLIYLSLRSLTLVHQLQKRLILFAQGEKKYILLKIKNLISLKYLIIGSCSVQYLIIGKCITELPAHPLFVSLQLIGEGFNVVLASGENHPIFIYKRSIYDEVNTNQTKFLSIQTLISPRLRNPLYCDKKLVDFIKEVSKTAEKKKKRIVSELLQEETTKVTKEAVIIETTSNSNGDAEIKGEEESITHCIKKVKKESFDDRMAREFREFQELISLNDSSVTI
jgi:hypothetical protein